MASDPIVLSPLRVCLVSAAENYTLLDPSSVSLSARRLNAKRVHAYRNVLGQVKAIENHTLLDL